jgi:hypothetical protein
MSKPNTKSEPPSLDEKVAALLRSDDQHPSSVLADLIVEVTQAIDAADQTGREARAAASNPKKLIDHGARGRAEDAEFQAHRLRNGLEAIQQLHHEAMARERLREWHLEVDEIEKRRNEVAAEFRERYVLLTNWLPDVLRRMAEVDREVERVTSRHEALEPIPPDASGGSQIGGPMTCQCHGSACARCAGAHALQNYSNTTTTYPHAVDRAMCRAMHTTRAPGNFRAIALGVVLASARRRWSSG